MGRVVWEGGSELVSIRVCACSYVYPPRHQPLSIPPPSPSTHPHQPPTPSSCITHLFIYLHQRSHPPLHRTCPKTGSSKPGTPIPPISPSSSSVGRSVVPSSCFCCFFGAAAAAVVVFSVVVFWGVVRTCKKERGKERERELGLSSSSFSFNDEYARKTTTTKKPKKPRTHHAALLSNDGEDTSIHTQTQTHQNNT